MSEVFRKCIKREPPTHLSIKFRCAKLHRVVDPDSGTQEATYQYNTIYDVFKARGWKETDPEKANPDERSYKNDWHVFWADKDWIHYEYDKVRLDQHQRVNHFRNHYELTRKDLLVKNMKRMRRMLEKEGKFDIETMNYCPTTFVLPQEYSMFVEEFKKGGGEMYLGNGIRKKDTNTWIMKPVGRSQGSGIFLMNKLNQIQQWRPFPVASQNDPMQQRKKDGPMDKEREEEEGGPEVYVVQRYIENPLLVGGKKFDLRLYVLVTSYMPLTVYLYHEGFCRFSMTRFTMDNIRDVKNVSAHLTNIAVQKQTRSSKAAYERTGAKWSICRFKQYLLATVGLDKVNELFVEIENLTIHSLQSVQKVMMNDKHCFELYGYDILLDSNYKATLIEVNASPSLTANTKTDSEMKFALLDDVLTIIDVEKYLDGNETVIGGFRKIFDGEKHIGGDENSVFASVLGTNSDRVVNLQKLAEQRAQALESNKTTTNSPAKKTYK